MNSHGSRSGLFAADIGNSQIKIGFFRELERQDFREPDAVIEISGAPQLAPRLGPFVQRVAGEFGERIGGESPWYLASVNRAKSRDLAAWIAGECSRAKVLQLRVKDVPIKVRVPLPESVGIDRIVAGWSANRLRGTGSPAVTIDVGTAITVDLIAADGAFLGGAILPGPGMSARALAENTDLLPHVPLERLGEAPSPLGTSTESAIRAGIFWGAVGSMREMVVRLSAQAGGRPEVFLTGGAARAVAGLLGDDVRYEPHLVLSGIAGICAENQGHGSNSGP